MTVNSSESIDALVATDLRYSEEELRHHLQLANTLVRHAADSFFLLDAEDRIGYANPAAQETFGWRLEELLGRRLHDVLHYLRPGGSPFPDSECPLVAVLTSGRTLRNHEDWFLRRDGSWVPVACSNAPILEDGQVRGAVLIVHDITERKRAEAELRAAKEAAESAQLRSAFLAEAGVLLAASLDYEETLTSLARLTVPRIADYCLLYELQASREIHQVAIAHVDAEKERLLERLGQIHHPSLGSPVSPLADVLRTGTPRFSSSPTPDMARAATNDDEVMGIYDRLQPRSWMILPLGVRGQTFGALVLATAESGRVYGDADFQLGRELASRAAVAMDNSRLYREARQANASKDRFLAALSHELRTPLAPVLAVVSSLESDERLRRELGSELAMVRRNVELEARLIDDLLDLTRIARGKLELHCQSADLRQIVAHALQSCDAWEVQRKRLCFVIDLAASQRGVWGDPPRLTQVFWNLFKNAVKFTPEGGTIRVRSRHEGEEVVVEVSDNGIGIAPEVLPRIFDAFEQADPAITRRFGGLGLGLAISKAIAELHGGRLTAASQGAGQGAVFTVHLPLAPSGVEALPLQQTADEGTRTAAEETSSLRILLIEDHPDTAEAMAELLSILGHQVTVAGDVASGRAAAEAAVAGPGVDLVISDLGLPDGTGFDLMRELSGRYGLKGIALSGYGTEEDLRKSREAGFLRHLTKPIDLGRLREVLRELA